MKQETTTNTNTNANTNTLEAAKQETITAQEVIITKGKEAIAAEKYKVGVQDARKEAVKAFVQGKTALDILRNPAVSYTYANKEFTAIVDASGMLDGKQKQAIFGNRTAKAAYGHALSRLADCVAADAAKKLEKNAPRISRNQALGILKQLATYLGYAGYTADKRDFDYIAMGMTGISKEADVQIKAAKKAVQSLFRVKLNGGNVRVMMQGGVEFSAEYMQTKAQKEREETAKKKADAKAAKEKADAKAAKEKEKELSAKKAEKKQDEAEQNKKVIEKVVDQLAKKAEVAAA